MVVPCAETQYVRMRVSRSRRVSYDSELGLLLKIGDLGLGNTGGVFLESSFRTCANNFPLARMSMISICLMGMTMMTQVALRATLIFKRRFDASSPKVSLIPKTGTV